MKFSLLFLSALLFLTQCTHYVRYVGDGVKEVNHNNKITYEGDPEKIKAYLAKGEAEKKGEADFQARVAKLPKRGESEPVRIGVLPTQGHDVELAKLQDRYHDMVVAALKAQKGIQVVPININVPKSPFNGDVAKGIQLNQELVSDLRKDGLDVDVILKTDMRPKSKQGFIRGNKGVAYAAAVVAQFNGKLTSFFKFQVKEFSEDGKSVTDFSAAGINTSGKTGAGSFKLARNPNLDEESARTYAAGIASYLNGKLKPDLPALTALQALLQERGVASKTREINIKDIKNLNDLKNLFHK